MHDKNRIYYLSPMMGLLFMVGLLLRIVSAQETPVGSGGIAPKISIVFHSNRDGNDEIYGMDSGGLWQRRLTENPANDGRAILSAHGDKLAFTSNRDGNLEVYSINADGTGLNRVTNNPAADVASSWSSDGQQLAFYSNRRGNYDIFLTNPQGGEPLQLTQDFKDDIEPSLSPDGSRIAFAAKRDGNYEIYVMDANGQNAVRLTTNEAADREPAWSPDGNFLVWSRREGGGNEDVYVMRADGSGPRRLTNSNGKDVRPTFSSDGKIIFASDRDGNMEIYAMKVDGSQMSRLTYHPAVDSEPYAALTMSIPTRLPTRLPTPVAQNPGGAAPANVPGPATHEERETPAPTIPTVSSDQAYSRLLAGQRAFTVECWVYLDSYGPKGGQIWSRRAANDVYGFIGPNGFIRFRVGGAWLDSPNNSVGLGQWFHVALAYADSQAEIYVNGVPKAFGRVGEPPGATSEGLTFEEYWDNEKGVFPLSGRVRNVKVHPQALSPGEALSAFRSNFTVAGTVVVSSK